MSERVTTTAVPIEGDDANRTVHRIDLDDGKANALSVAMIAEIRGAITQAEADPNCVAAVLVGREGRFSAGFDLSVMGAGDQSAVTTMVADGGDLVRHIYGARIPVVAACTAGFAGFANCCGMNAPRSLTIASAAASAPSITRSGSVNTSSAPYDFKSARRSSDMLAGIVNTSL